MDKQSKTIRFGFLFRLASFWIGVHYSDNDKRFCINFLPCITFWITLPGGRVPVKNDSTGTGMSQSKTGSFIESCANVAIGYLVALGSQLVIFPAFGIHVPFSTNLAIGAWFTVVSLIRSYVLRRIFNSLTLQIEG